MSADEIRRLTDLSTHDMPEYCQVTVIWTKKWGEIKAALLSYAAMVERCDGKITSLERHQKECLDCGLTLQAKVDGFKLKDINYILRGDAGKEEV